jgi:hypothetical protein
MKTCPLESMTALGERRRIPKKALYADRYAIR